MTNEPDLSSILDPKIFQSFLDTLYEHTGIGGAVLDLSGKIIVSTGWQDICAKFHRVHPETSKNCLESDTQLSQGVSPGTYKLYKCKNNMWDVSIPIEAGGIHIGNLFLGQFLFDDEEVDVELFRAQASRYGFDEQAYMEALMKVPRWNRETMNFIMHLYIQFAGLISRMSLSNLELARNIVELKQKEAEINVQVQFLQQLINTIPNPTFFKDTKGLYQGCNDAFQAFVGKKRSEIIGKSVYDLYDNTTAEIFFAKDNELLNQPGIQIYETVFPRHDGSPRNIQVHKATYNNPDGTIKGLIGVMVDITDRIQSENDTRVNLEKYRVIFDSFPGGVAISNEAGEIIEANEESERLLGLASEEQRQRKIDGIEWKIIRPDGTPMPAEEYASVRALKEKRKVENVEMGIVKEKEAITWIRVSATPIPLEGFGVLITYSDITNRKKEEQTLKENLHQLERFNKIMIGRELKMIELKKEIARLKDEGRGTRRNSIFTDHI